MLLGMKDTTNLTQRQIFWFWVPLAAMWLMMAIEQPSLTAVISRYLRQEKQDTSDTGEW